MIALLSALFMKEFGHRDGVLLNFASFHALYRCQENTLFKTSSKARLVLMLSGKTALQVLHYFLFLSWRVLFCLFSVCLRTSSHFSVCYGDNVNGGRCKCCCGFLHPTKTQTPLPIEWKGGKSREFAVPG